jgi:hypothetical protein
MRDKSDKTRYWSAVSNLEMLCNSGVDLQQHSIR